MPNRPSAATAAAILVIGMGLLIVGIIVIPASCNTVGLVMVAWLNALIGNFNFRISRLHRMNSQPIAHATFDFLLCSLFLFSSKCKEKASIAGKTLLPPAASLNFFNAV